MYLDIRGDKNTVMTAGVDPIALVSLASQLRKFLCAVVLSQNILPDESRDFTDWTASIFLSEVGCQSESNHCNDYDQ